MGLQASVGQDETSKQWRIALALRSDPLLVSLPLQSARSGMAMSASRSFHGVQNYPYTSLIGEYLLGEVDRYQVLNLVNVKRRY